MRTEGCRDDGESKAMIEDPVNYSPTEIRRTDAGIEIQWSDGDVTRWTARQLRDSCPCATCREKRGGKDAGDQDDPEGSSATQAPPRMLPVLSAAEARPLRIEAMRPVGTYAYNIVFSDGHHSGLFTFPRLREPESR